MAEDRKPISPSSKEKGRVISTTSPTTSKKDENKEEKNDTVKDDKMHNKRRTDEKRSDEKRKDEKRADRGDEECEGPARKVARINYRETTSADSSSNSTTSNKPGLKRDISEKGEEKTVTPTSTVTRASSPKKGEKDKAGSQDSTPITSQMIKATTPEESTSSPTASPSAEKSIPVQRSSLSSNNESENESSDKEASMKTESVCADKNNPDAVDDTREDEGDCLSTNGTADVTSPSKGNISKSCSGNSSTSATKASESNSIISKKEINESDGTECRTNDEVYNSAVIKLKSWAEQQQFGESAVAACVELVSRARGYNSIKLDSMDNLAAVMFISARKMGVACTYKEICQVSGVPLKVLAHTQKNITEVLGLPNPEPLSSMDTIKRFLNNLRLPEDVYNASIIVCTRALDANVVSGKCPISLAAAVLVLICQCTEKDVVKVSNVSITTIKSSVQLLQQTQEMLMDGISVPPRPNVFTEEENKVKNTSHIQESAPSKSRTREISPDSGKVHVQDAEVLEREEEHITNMISPPASKIDGDLREKKETKNVGGVASSDMAEEARKVVDTDMVDSNVVVKLRVRDPKEQEAAETMSGLKRQISQTMEQDEETVEVLQESQAVAQVSTNDTMNDNDVRNDKKAVLAALEGPRYVRVKNNNTINWGLPPQLIHKDDLLRALEKLPVSRFSVLLRTQPKPVHVKGRSSRRTDIQVAAKAAGPAQVKKALKTAGGSNSTIQPGAAVKTTDVPVKKKRGRKSKKEKEDMKGLVQKNLAMQQIAAQQQQQMLHQPPQQNQQLQANSSNNQHIPLNGKQMPPSSSPMQIGRKQHPGTNSLPPPPFTQGGQGQGQGPPMMIHQNQNHQQHPSQQQNAPPQQHHQLMRQHSQLQQSQAPQMQQMGRSSMQPVQRHTIGVSPSMHAHDPSKSSKLSRGDRDMIYNPPQQQETGSYRQSEVLDQKPMINSLYKMPPPDEGRSPVMGESSNSGQGPPSPTNRGRMSQDMHNRIWAQQMGGSQGGVGAGGPMQPNGGPQQGRSMHHIQQHHGGGQGGGSGGSYGRGRGGGGGDDPNGSVQQQHMQVQGKKSSHHPQQHGGPGQQGKQSGGQGGWMNDYENGAQGGAPSSQSQQQRQHIPQGMQDEWVRMEQQHGIPKGMHSDRGPNQGMGMMKGVASGGGGGGGGSVSSGMRHDENMSKHSQHESGQHVSGVQYDYMGPGDRSYGGSGGHQQGTPQMHHPNYRYEDSPMGGQQGGPVSMQQGQMANEGEWQYQQQQQRGGGGGGGGSYGNDMEGGPGPGGGVPFSSKGGQDHGQYSMYGDERMRPDDRRGEGTPMGNVPQGSGPPHGLGGMPYMKVGIRPQGNVGSRSQSHGGYPPSY
eukprot:CFRG2085T1